ncbi:hypothetical protein CU664_12140 [Pseudomonas syringae pv. actinidifoliorum]|uniref:suppressor of fused domain protein n=1 Tax=Pseudomonas syringae TaxID=317 RepID=UPI0013732458|nr:suppressor of fused domain protein [Pseudomonas syringae]NAS99010.1 hypothetical protein [Pseudomonas syringae pv. actinidifoliorum]NAT63976.1 hypothetical protein [Pseudomonas syringae pv. actinidifoliorum]
MKRVPSPQRTAIVKHELSVFGKNDFRVNNYYNDNKTLSLELLTVPDEIDRGMISIGTVGLSETALRDDEGAEFITRVELCAGAPKDEKEWCNFVISTAFKILRTENAVMPGEVMENIIYEYFPDAKMPHIYLTVPFLWNEGHFPELLFSDVRVNWLQCIAIHDSEKNFIDEHGSAKFEDLLSKNDVNIFDKTRVSVLDL